MTTRNIKDLTPTEGAAQCKTDIRALRNSLSSFALSLDTVDHGTALFVNQARSDLFAAWSKLRIAEQRLEAIAEGKPIPTTCLTDNELVNELGVN